MDEGYSEKRKKSWKEIDQQRDRSQHRREPRPDHPPGTRPGRSSARYRAALEKAFNTGSMGKVAERLSAAMPDAPRSSEDGKEPSAPARQKLIHQVTSAAHTKEAVEALNELMKHFDLPDDFDVLTRALEHPDEDVTVRVMHKLEAMLKTQKPRRPRTLVARLRLLEEDFDRPEEIRDLAVRLQQLL